MPCRHLLTWIALYAVLALATNGLLALHLWGCCDHACDSCDSSSPHSRSHDSQECPLCRILLGHLGKYLVEMPAPIERVGTIELCPILPGEQKYAQTTRSPRIPRGPPV